MQSSSFAVICRFGGLLRAANWIWVLAAAALVSFAAPPLYADEILSITLSNVSFTGNSVCGASGTDPCVETFSGSFLWDNTTLTFVPGSGTATSQGPLGTFSLIGGFVTGKGIFLGNWQNTDGSANIFFEQIIGPLFLIKPGDYPINGTTLPTAFVRCNTDSCNNEGFGVSSPQGDLIISPTPEPSSVGLAVLGLVALAVPFARRRRAG